MLPAGPQSPRSPSPSKMLQAPRASAEPESDVGAPSTYADSDLSDSDFPDDYGVIAGEEPAPESAAAGFVFTPTPVSQDEVSASLSHVQGGVIRACVCSTAAVYAYIYA